MFSYVHHYLQNHRPRRIPKVRLFAVSVKRRTIHLHRPRFESGAGSPGSHQQVVWSCPQERAVESTVGRQYTGAEESAGHKQAHCLCKPPLSTVELDRRCTAMGLLRTPLLSPAGALQVKGGLSIDTNTHPAGAEEAAGHERAHRDVRGPGVRGGCGPGPRGGGRECQAATPTPGAAPGGRHPPRQHCERERPGPGLQLPAGHFPQGCFLSPEPPSMVQPLYSSVLPREVLEKSVNF